MNMAIHFSIQNFKIVCSIFCVIGQEVHLAAPGKARGWNRGGPGYPEDVRTRHDVPRYKSSASAIG
jgi:hypothetical protein